MKIEIDTELKKIFILETINLKDFLDNLGNLGILDSKVYTIEVKSPIIVVPYQTNPIIISPTTPHKMPRIEPNIIKHPYIIPEIWCSIN